jgi:hypothetical protein
LKKPQLRESTVSTVDVIVLAGSVLAIVGLGWFFFAPRRAGVAEQVKACSGSA